MKKMGVWVALSAAIEVEIFLPSITALPSVPPLPVLPTLPPAVPGIPSFLTVSDPGLDSLTLEWGPPKDQNGRLTGYTLTYQPGMSSQH